VDWTDDLSPADRPHEVRPQWVPVCLRCRRPVYLDGGSSVGSEHWVHVDPQYDVPHP
jgi:hypothetical protein